ncbi:MAG: single-stranded-DNA-specific exonuclease RecJ [Acidobacteriia bacterium]|nr:single-stranded-DNA-specific exonuclease RecJ [Terriglobia bacterium]
MRWELSVAEQGSVARLGRELGVSSLLARLLVLRGIGNPEAAERFLNPALSHLHDPYRMADMRAAVVRLRQAIAQREKILIYGDYDVDGTMAVVVLLTALRTLGASVEAHIPHRLADGYGMRVPVIEQAHAEGYRVVLSVDTGIGEHDALGRARQLGLDCIVTDHHLPKGDLPPASAILNPHRSDCPYPEKNLSGVGVAFKLAQALLAEQMAERQVESYLKIVALGTIADVVPLVGENRVIARFGLAGLGEPSQPGLAALIAVSGLAGRTVTAGDVGFRLAPRLNAAGRREDAREVIELLTTSDVARARAIAERLDNLNRERQRVEEQILAAIVEEMDHRPEKAGRYTLVFSGEGWHRGVIGIVAQRVVELYHRPALVIGVEDGVGVGSGRSIKGFHLLEALTPAGDLFDRYGGHAQAAGFAMAAACIPQLEARFEQHARAVLAPEDLEPGLRIDAEVSLSDLTWGRHEELTRLEPFGFGNPTPVLAARGVRVLAPPRVLKEKHLKLRVAQGVNAFDALGWGMADRLTDLRAGDTVDMAFTLDENYYQGERTLQLVIKDLCKR